MRKSQRDKGVRSKREIASLIGETCVYLSGAVDRYSNDVNGKERWI